MVRYTKKAQETILGRTQYFNSLVIGDSTLKRHFLLCATALARARYLDRPAKYGVRRVRSWIEFFRVDRTQFLYLVDLIKGDPVFVSNGPRAQAPVEYQLAVALWRFGHSGTACGYRKIAINFGLSEGSVQRWTCRVILALLNHEADVVKWPDADRRALLETVFEEEYGIPGGCVGVVDGCFIPTARRPAREDFTKFYSHKGRYGFNVAFVCDTSKRIRFAQYGFPGASHDSQVYNHSELNRAPQQLFSPGQWVLADSTFSVGLNCVPLFPHARGEATLPGDKRKFNQACSPARVLIENTFDILKYRWGSLQALPSPLRNRSEEGIASCWIRACVVLHNLFVDSGDWFTHPEPDEIEKSLEQAEKKERQRAVRKLLIQEIAVMDEAPEGKN
ncbi:hypothetical protein I350_01966 [Cryptococcus amylolentus CBS 6273]|uniref:DDE Tnp4 domain-containing protein n=1 Tax=Cryptococcus amylolentus CBS 6273 TaxID=1296118 RepID=A0A1E3K9G9_9TREE|nr:hypothetical protein I350_01966 [Cryptococcus amylolentus CBS 6273]